MSLFSRLFGASEPDAPTALHTVADSLGWARAVVAGHNALLPPSFERADAEQLRGRAQQKTAQGWAVTGDGMTASHLDVYHDEFDSSVYDVVRWSAPSTTAALPHLELRLGGSPYGGHRMADRFGHTGSRKHPVPVAGLTLVALRSCSAPALTRLAGHPALAALPALGARVGRGGFSVELVAGRAAAFALTGVARRGTDRWLALIDAARLMRTALDDAALVDAAPADG